MDLAKSIHVMRLVWLEGETILVVMTETSELYEGKF